MPSRSSELPADHSASSPRHAAGVQGTLTVIVDATPEATLATVRHLDLTLPVNR